MAKNTFRILLSALIPSRTWRGLVYTSFCKQFPIESPSNKIPPEIFNSQGEKMHVFYLQDKRMGIYGGYSRHILWDRYNYALKNHFYTQKAIMRTKGKPVRKYAWFLESEAITPDDFRLFDLYPGLANEFNLIFTNSARILDKYPNARFSISSPIWYDEPLLDSAWEHKTRNISIVSSAKVMCPLHKYRIAVAKLCKERNLADTFGTFDGGPIIPLSLSLKDYRFSIVIENNVSPYFFTERITSCFAAMTIPIYYGATEINRFFNPDGIVFIPDLSMETLEKVLRQCTEKEYEARLEAVKENFLRVQNFQTPEDYMWDNYLCHEGIE